MGIGVYLCARRQYLLWQMHTTYDRAVQDNATFGPANTFSQMRVLSSAVAVVLPDTRAERTVQRICSEATYQDILQRHVPPRACVLLLTAREAPNTAQPPLLMS